MRKQFDIDLLLTILWERKHILMLVTFLIVAPIFIGSIFIKPVFESKADILIEKMPHKSPFIKEDILFNRQYEPVDLKIHTTFLKSDEFLDILASNIPDDIIEKLLPPQRNENDNLTEEFTLLPSLTGLLVEPDLAREDLMKILDKSVVYSRREPAMISMRVSTADPQVSYFILTKILEIYSHENLRRNRTEVVATRTFIEQLKNKSEAELIIAQNKLLEIKNNYGIYRQSERIDNLGINAEIEGLEQKISLQKDNYLMLSDRFMEVRIREEETINNIRIINQPTYSSLPSGSTKMKVRLLGIIGGLLISLITIFSIEYLQDLINSSSGIRLVTKTPTIATIPFLESAKRKTA